ncbi:hypothetical protein F5146DRAFT_270901 [Armillaria mellea]|nr:hypothetical protein F5146DRAFT_270901 [Armillaria mellea]
MPPNTKHEIRRSSLSDRRILIDIQDILDDDLSIYRVPFAYCREYGMDTPNPFFHIQDFGKFSLPLSKRDAQALISFHEKDVSQPTNSCEFSNCGARFMNPQWEEWVENMVAKDARNLLGLPPCECEFGKMLLRLARSVAPPLQSGASEDRLVFGTVEILLPSWFTGGDVTYE